MQHTNDVPPSLRSSGTNISPAVEHVVMRALAKDPQHRYESVLAFAQSFEQASRTQSQQLQLSSSPPSLYQTRPISPAPNSWQAQQQPGRTEEHKPLQPGGQTQQLVGTSTGANSSIPKPRISRKVLLIIAISLVLLAVIGVSSLWVLNRGLPWLATQSSSGGTITGSVVSVNASAHSVTLNVNGQQVTVSGLADQQIVALQSQVNKTYTFNVQAGQSGSNNYAINTGTDPTQTDNGTPDTNSNTGVPVPGTISFIGKVQSYNAGTLIVAMPNNQSLSMSAVNGQTELKTTPQVGQFIRVDAQANPDGSFMATKIDATISADLQDTVLLNTVTFKGVTTQAVGSNGNLTFKVGNKSFSSTINGTTELKDLANAQAIGANQPIMVTVLYSGSVSTVQKVASSP